MSETADINTERVLAEIRKMNAEVVKMNAETKKYIEEADKLRAEARKYDRDRSLAWLAAGVGLMTITLAIVTLAAKMLRLIP